MSIELKCNQTKYQLEQAIADVERNVVFKVEKLQARKRELELLQDKVSKMKSE